jgi:hypothetical protein
MGVKLVAPPPKESKQYPGGGTNIIVHCLLVLPRNEAHTAAPLNLANGHVGKVLSEEENPCIQHLAYQHRFIPAS